MTNPRDSIGMLELPKLTQVQMDSEHLANIAANELASFLAKFEESDDMLLPCLPQHWRAVYTAYLYEWQVINGGHHQYFWNYEGALNSQTLEDLVYLGAEPFVTIFREALAVYSAHDYANEKSESATSSKRFQDGYHDKRFAECDDRFYEEKKEISDYLAEHIRRNATLFCGP
jgi:hypothetical protein